MKINRQNKLNVLLTTLFSFLLILNSFTQGTWTIISSGTSNSLWGLKFLDANTGYVCGAQGTIRKTTNGGTSWTAQNINAGYTYDIDFINQNTGWVCTEQGKIFRTTNGGSAWNESTVDSEEKYCIAFKTSSELYTAGYGNLIYKSLDGGVTFSSFNPGGDLDFYLDIFISQYNSNKMWLVGDSGKVLYTHNNGSTWNQLTISSSPLYDVFFIDENIGWTVGGNGSIFKTIDSGVSWNQQIMPGTTGDLTGVSFYDSNNGWAVGSGGTMIYTNNGGSTWNNYSSPTSIYLHNIQMVNATTGYVVGGNGVLLKFNPPSPPNCTSLSSPSNGAINVPVTTTFSWPAASGNPTGYKLNVGTTSGGTQILNNFDVGNILTYDPPGNLPYGTTIYVKVIPYNSEGNASNCQEKSFTTVPNSPPNCTFLSSPINNSTNVLVSSSLSWMQASGAPTGYKLTVGTTLTGGEIMNNINVGNVTTYNPAGNFPCGTLIYVKIVPYNSFGDAVGCVTESFTTQPISCPTNLFITSQSEINNFATNYPCCFEIPGYLSIAGTAIINLNGLSQITSVGDIFELYQTHVTNLAGLENLHKIGGIAYIHYNSPYLTNLNGLNNLDSIYGNLEIFANAVGLNNIQALSNLDYIGDELRIQFNPNLSNCAISEICEYVAMPPAATFIGNNGVGCNNTGEILTSCNPTFPLCTNLTSPLNGATNVLVDANISWAVPNGNPTGYKLTIGTTPQGAEILNNFDLGNVTTYDLPANLPYGVIIYVKVIPYNNNGITNWCLSESFTTQPLPLPNCTILTYPLNGGINVPTTATLNWTAATGNPTGYILIAETYPGWADILNVDVGNVTSYNPPDDFPPNATISLKIIPYNSFGDAIGCVFETFTISNFSCGQLTSPINGSSNVQRTTSLTWSPVAGNPSGYKLTLGTSPNNANILATTDIGNVLTYDLPGEFPQDSTIYVKIAPLNQYGEATGCINEFFETAPLITANGPWRQLDVGLSYEPFDIEFDTAGNLLAVGNFSHAGGLAANNFAKWNGNSWSQFQPYISTFKIIVDSLTNNIYAFSSNTVQFLDNGIWTTIGLLTSGFINDVHLVNGFQLYVTGNFNEISGVSASKIAMWDGINWNALGSGLNNTGSGLASFGSNSIYVIGNFTTAGGNAANHIAKWNGSNWSALGGGVAISNYIDCDLHGNLYTINQKWNGSIWTNISTSINGSPYGIIAVDSNEVYLYGSFTTINNLTTGHIGKWNGTSWSPVGYPGPNVGTNSSGSNHNVNKMVINEVGEIYVIGSFLQTSGVAVNYIAKYDSTIQIPSCTKLSSPANNATNVFVNSNLSWASADNAAGYKIFVGTTIGGSELLNNVDVGNVLTYNPSVNFNYNTTYYVRIVPYNSFGESLACFESTFKTTLNGGQGLAYIPNRFSGDVSVVSLLDFNVLATIPVGGGPIGVSITPDGSKVFIANAESNTVSVINSTTNTVSNTITVGSFPTGITVNNDGTKVYVANQNSNTVSVINTTTMSVVATINVNVKPTSLITSPNDSLLYVSNDGSNNVSVINTNTNLIVATIVVGVQPRGLVTNFDGSRLFVANYLSNTVSIINTATNTVLFTKTVGVKPTTLTFHPDGTKLYVCNNGSGTVSVISVPSYGTLLNISTPSPYGSSISCNGNILMTTSPIAIPTATSDKVYFINTLTNTVIAELIVNDLPVALGNFISNGIMLNELLLNASNSPLSGSYNAAQSIQVTGNVNINANTSVELNARKVKIMSPLNSGLNSQMKINRRGCIE